MKGIRISNPAQVRKLMFGVVLLAVVTVLQTAVGWVTAASRTDSSVSSQSAVIPVLRVQLIDGAESYHLRQLQRAGVLGARASATDLTLLRVPPENVQWLSRQVWVKKLSLP